MEKKTHEVCILKKFFVYKAYRGKEIGVGADLFDALLNDAEKQGFSKILLDTPSVATRSHSFYEKVGFKNIDKKDLPIQYDYPDRNSLIYELNLSRLS
ncbi:GNAT family N-acetyltransferase [Guptibacillus spartinae]|uniref:GNAT family N-acetyltransferase n=1 Tax=Guptibacillus spartinae TaxID=3025679 RepID=UPI002362BAE6|nr:GNAT family N-acetyltransferase [Pseudalkalibacillus spartinae]